MESLGLSNLPHFTSGGSIHIIVNNQLGYTTPAANAHSSVYTSDVGKMINAPVIHVNGDHPEDVVRAAVIAYDYRNKFRKDVVLDLITYRRWGHNELDEPGFTQPLMYENIRTRKSVPRLYEERLVSEGLLEQEQVDKIRREYHNKLDNDMKNLETFKPKAEELSNKWKGIQFPSETVSKLDTGVDTEMLAMIGKASVATPPDLVVHPRLQKFHVQTRLKNIEGGKS